MVETLAEDQKALIVSSFVTVMEDPEAFAAKFYEQLFELDPSLKPMFKGDITEQGRKLMQTLSVLVNSIYNLDEVIPAIEALGKRHVRYGVQVSHFDTVGSALISTLATTLGEEFSPPVRDAWKSTYALVVTIATQNNYAEVETHS